MVTTTGGPQVIVQAHGDVSSADREYARSKIERLHGLAGAPVLVARVDLRVFADPARDRPADAKASLDVNGRLVRAHVAAGTVPEAIDLLEARLRERLARAAGRAAPDRSGARGGSARRADRPGFASLALEDRVIVAHETFAVGDVDEAVDLLELGELPFVFFVDPERERGHVLYRRYDGQYGLIEPADRPPRASAGV